MKKLCVFTSVLCLLTVLMTCFPRSSYSQGVAEKADAVPLFSRSIELIEIAEEIENKGDELLRIAKSYAQMAERSNAQTHTSIQDAQRVWIMFEVWRSIHETQLICFYEAQLLSLSPSIKPDLKRAYYDLKKMSLNDSKNWVALNLEKLQSHYGDIDNVAALHLIDEAKKNMKLSLKHIESSLEDITTIEELIDSTNEKGDVGK